ncbi:MAG: hypothetical protein KDH15_06875 [Rhodocyclaceae bacterium]|nr:hypothetical protein [Rhodocyclaceae bacterium]
MVFAAGRRSAFVGVDRDADVAEQRIELLQERVGQRQRLQQQEQQDQRTRDTTGM